MSFRNHTAMAALLATLTACATEPAHADVFHDNLPADPARPGWSPPIVRSHIPMDGNHYDFDPGAGPLPLEHLQDDLWIVRPGTWGASTAPLPLPPPHVVTPCRPPAAVPGPLPLAGVAAAFGWARRLRGRVG